MLTDSNSDTKSPISNLSIYVDPIEPTNTSRSKLASHITSQPDIFLSFFAPISLCQDSLSNSCLSCFFHWGEFVYQFLYSGPTHPVELSTQKLNPFTPGRYLQSIKPATPKKTAGIWLACLAHVHIALCQTNTTLHSHHFLHPLTMSIFLFHILTMKNSV